MWEWPLLSEPDLQLGAQERAISEEKRRACGRRHFQPQRTGRPSRTRAALRPCPPPFPPPHAAVEKLATSRGLLPLPLLDLHVPPRSVSLPFPSSLSRRPLSGILLRLKELGLIFVLPLLCLSSPFSSRPSVARSTDLVCVLGFPATPSDFTSTTWERFTDRSPELERVRALLYSPASGDGPEERAGRPG